MEHLPRIDAYNLRGLFLGGSVTSVLKEDGFS